MRSLCRVSAPQHDRVLVVVFVFEQLTVGGVVVGRSHPLPRHDARQGDADVGRTVQPAGGRFGGQPEAQSAGEMVTVLLE